MRRVCVFCGSRTGGESIYAEQARLLGLELSTRGMELVFGGGHIGLMGILADAILACGGRAIGVIPQALVDKELAHERLTELHVVQSMHERKAVMADLSDAFLALPGAYGTADELFEILTWSQLGLHSKPVGLLNVAGFFTSMLDWLDRAVKEGFLKPNHRHLLLESDNVAQLLDMLANYRAPGIQAKWIKQDER
jgi:uncharacterized protein (TIGR00730 family)